MDMSKVQLPPYIGVWTRSQVSGDGVTLVTAGTCIMDGFEAIKNVYPDAEAFGDEVEARNKLIGYRLKRSR